MRLFKKSILQTVALPILSFVLALFFGGLLISLSDSRVTKLIGSPFLFIKAALASSGNAYLALLQGAFFDPNLVDGHSLLNGFYPLSETLVAAAPLIMTGLSVALAFRAGLFNIGAQGQFIFGAIAASYVGFHFEMNPILHVTLCISAAMLVAGLYGGIVGFLKARTGAHEVIVTIMLNYVASYFIVWILSTTAFLQRGRQDPLAPPVKQSARLPLLAGSELRVNFGIIIALFAAILVWWLLSRTTWGFRFRAVGANSAAAKTAGISVGFVMTASMFICGALAGLGSAIHVLGSDYSLTIGTAGSLGFDAITVALLGRGSPIGVVLSALLFGALRAGGLTMQANTQTPIDIVLVIQALVVLFIAAPTLVRAIFRFKNLNVSESIASKGWNG